MLDLLELELQELPDTGAVNQTQIFWKCSAHSEPLSHVSSSTESSKIILRNFLHDNWQRLRPVPYLQVPVALSTAHRYNALRQRAKMLHGSHLEARTKSSPYL